LPPDSVVCVASSVISTTIRSCVATADPLPPLRPTRALGRRRRRVRRGLPRLGALKSDCARLGAFGDRSHDPGDPIGDVSLGSISVERRTRTATAAGV
jgi:hypothetical protein